MSMERRRRDADDGGSEVGFYLDRRRVGDMDDSAANPRTDERRSSRRRFIVAGAVATTTTGIGGCLAVDAPVAEPEEGFAELRLRVVNDGSDPVDAFVTVTSDDDEGGNEVADETSIIGLPPGRTAETRSTSYPRRPYVVHVPAGEQPTYRWNADVCAAFELELRFRDDDVGSSTGCAREW